MSQELKGNFTQRIPGTQVTFDVAWSPKCIDKRCYDYAALANTTDFLFIMAYGIFLINSIHLMK